MEELDKQSEKWYRGYQQSQKVKEYLDGLTKDSFLICASFNTNDDWDEFTNVSSAKYSIEVAMNRNSVDVSLRTNGKTIEMFLEKTWFEVTSNNFFSLVIAYMLMNPIDICCCD